jgi:hypothetical protein
VAELRCFQRCRVRERVRCLVNQSGPSRRSCRSCRSELSGGLFDHEQQLSARHAYARHRIANARRIKGDVRLSPRLGPLQHHLNPGQRLWRRLLDQRFRRRIGTRVLVVPSSDVVIVRFGMTQEWPDFDIAGLVELTKKVVAALDDPHT